MKYKQAMSMEVSVLPGPTAVQSQLKTLILILLYYL